jgi:hypothetical protein
MEVDIGLLDGVRPVFQPLAILTTAKDRLEIFSLTWHQHAYLESLRWRRWDWGYRGHGLTLVLWHVGNAEPTWFEWISLGGVFDNFERG